MNWNKTVALTWAYLGIPETSESELGKNKERKCTLCLLLLSEGRLGLDPCVGENVKPTIVNLSKVSVFSPGITQLTTQA